MRNGALLTLRAELVRVATSAIAWFAAALTLLVSWLRVYASVVAERVRRAEAAASGRELTSDLEAGTAWPMLVDGWRAGLMLSTAVILIAGARTVAGDRESGLLRLGVTRSTSRVGAVVGRALVGPVLVAALVLLSGLGAWIGAVVTGGGDFGDQMMFGSPLFAAEEVRESLVLAIVIASLGLAAIHAFGVLVSTLIPGPLIAVAAALVSVVLWDVLKDVVGMDAAGFVFATHAPTFDDSSPMTEMVKISRGMSDGVISDEVQRKGTFFPAVEAVLFVGLACLAIRRKRI